MTTRHPLPRPLFDTLEQLSEPIPACVSHYLTTTGIAESLHEFKLTHEFLASYAGSPDTYNAYRREVERLLHWSWLIAKKPLKDISRNDIRDFITFSTDPPIPWIGTKTVARFINNAEGIKIHNPEWRPYVARISKARYREGQQPDKQQYTLNNKSIQSLFAGISTYFTYLQQEDYLQGNPVQLVRQKNRFIQRQQSQKVTRKLSHLQWEYVIDTASLLAQQNPEHERTLFALSAFYLLGLRISELADTPGRIPKMGDFAPDKHGLWWFTTVGKGNKVRDVAVPDAMLAALKRYRLHCGLTALPSRDEPTPLLHKQRGKGGLGTRQIRYLIQSCFDAAITKLQAADKEDEAQDLATATVHWLRHTAISADVEERPREHIRDDVGHENAATMDKYIDTDRVARHASAKYKKLKKDK